MLRDPIPHPNIDGRPQETMSEGRQRPTSVGWADKKDGEETLEEERKNTGFSLTLAHSHPNSVLGYDLERSETGILTLGKLTMRAKDDELPQSWWFASTAIPLIAATIGPLANVLSIAALASKWRVTLLNNGDLPDGADNNGIDIDDPEWELILNAFSLAFGFVGNFFLLCNFTKRIRYIISLPATIICWFFSMGLLMGIIAAMYIYARPVSPGETWSQGYWHAVIATILYAIGSITLMINMLGYFLGKYPQHFDLDDDQRTLILQTMMFFFWLAGGAGVFANVNGWNYANALYFCNVTVLTIGYGDFVPQNDTARGLVFLYSIFGIIFLGLMINSIRKFAESMSKDKVIKAHQEHERTLTFGRSVTSETELRDRLGLPPRRASDTRRESSAITKLRSASVAQYGDLEIKGRTVTFHEHKKKQVRGGGRGGAGRSATAPIKPKLKRAMSRDEKIAARKVAKSEKNQRHDRRQKLLLLKEERDRFDAMRDIQENTKKFRQYYALAASALAFSILWCMGALVFMLVESREQENFTYFDALYFCWVSLITIGYGDYSPRSNAGKPFFVLWSLIAIPTMTILINDLGDTVVGSINRGTFTLAEWTVMPKVGAYRDFLEANPKFREWLVRLNQKRQEKKRLESGFGLQDPDEKLPEDQDMTTRKSSVGLEKLAEDNLTDHDLARKLATAIKRIAHDLRHEPPIKYKYEDWVEFTRLIRFSASKSPEEMELAEEEQGIVEWDWIGEDSPMLTSQTEAEWVLDRLCESLNRYSRKNARKLREESAIAGGVRKFTMKSFRPGNVTHRFSREESLDPLAGEEFEPGSSGSSHDDLEKLSSGEKDGGELSPGWKEGDPFAQQTPESPPPADKSTGKEKEKEKEKENTPEPDSAAALAERVRRMSKAKKSNDTAAIKAWEEKLRKAREARKSKGKDD